MSCAKTLPAQMRQSGKTEGTQYSLLEMERLSPQTQPCRGRMRVQGRLGGTPTLSGVLADPGSQYPAK